MDDLVNAVSAKTGLSHDQALAAAQAVLDYLKSRLPAPIAGQIDSVVKGGGNPGDIAKNLGGMFGQK